MSDRLGSKRKAADDLQWPPDTQDSARQRSTAESTIKLTSILSILRANCRERLYVKPMAWTSSQLRHLDCKFEAQKNPRTRKERPPQAGPQDPSILITRRSRCNLPTARISPELIRATMQLSGCKTLIGKKYAIEEILSAFDIYPLPSECLSFYFGRQPAAKIRTEGVFLCNSASPCLAYISFDRIWSLREMCIHRRPCGFNNIPVINTRRKQLRLIQPPNPAEDPYIMAVLIALAQEQRRQQDADSQHRTRASACQIIQQDDNTAAFPAIGPKSRIPGQSFKVNVLAIPGVQAELLYVYTAIISAEFLDRFDEPSSCLPRLPVVATYRCIPLKNGTIALKMLHGLVCASSCRLCDGVNAPGSMLGH